MEFQLDEFTINPSVEKLDRCRKADLLLIANFYDIRVPYNGRKEEWKQVLIEELVVRGVLSPMPGAKGEMGQGAAELVTASPEVLSVSMDPAVSPSMSKDELSLVLRIEEVKMKAREVELRTREAERQAMHLKVRALELERTQPPPPVTPVGENQHQNSSSSAGTGFDVSRQIALVPQFRESEVDSYFNAFERIAATLHWPKEVWPLLLQCKLVGKAQEVCASLTIEDSLNYDVVKATVLRAYELVPEAYRQKFRNCGKNINQTYGEFAREKGLLFDKWCQASKVANFAQLRELLLLEEFKNCIPEKIGVYLNEQKVTALSEAAVLADEFALTHKTVFSSPARQRRSNSGERGIRAPKSPRRNFSGAEGKIECFYCHATGHRIAVCPVLKRNGGKTAKGSEKDVKNPSAVGLIQTRTSINQNLAVEDIDEDFKPFVTEGSVVLTSNAVVPVPITILRDTGAKHSFIRSGVLPFSDETYCGSDILVWGIKMSVIRVPVHAVNLSSPLVSGPVQVGVRAQLPVSGVDFILGNDLAGKRVFPSPEVIENPTASECDFSAASTMPSVFPACAVTRAQARRLGDVVDISDSFMVGSDDPPGLRTDEKCPAVSQVEIDDAGMSLSVDKSQLVEAQQSDSTLTLALSIAQTGKDSERPVSYLFDDGVLVRQWMPGSGLESEAVYQIVVPQKFRSQVLSLAHDHSLAGHLGIRKTYRRILRYFYWPGLKSDVGKFCRSCHVCQVTGKPNQVIPAAPLHPIPVLGEPFEHVIVDCVGPLPKTKSGHQYILTMMCSATRFPEAVPLRTLKARPIVKAMVKFFSTFGLPKRIQTDQGSNFLSKVFAQVMSELAVKHQTSSAYHPESQGALERFHQTLKSMLRKFCSGSNREWDEGLPLLMFAVRETVQESLGFSPADLVFGHTVRGPLRLLREKWLADPASQSRNILDYVSSFREKLHKACELARESLAATQFRMKERFDRKTVARVFHPGDEVLVLLPVPGPSLQAKFSGPYVVESKLSDTDYVIKTPDRKKKSRVCHINMLKIYHVRESPVEVPTVSAVVNVMSSTYSPEEDGLDDKHGSIPCARLKNAEVLAGLDDFLSHLPESGKNEICVLIKENMVLFGDVPTQTHVLSHDIDVGDHKPLKQHAYRVNPTKRAVMLKEADYLIAHGFAVPSSSPWSSPSLLVPKSDQTPRFCTDYRRVNAITKPDSFPLPRMEDCVDRVGSAKYVTKLDLLKGYWQVPLTSRASEISAFVTPDYFLQYTVMPFGLRNAPATFQRLMSKVLHGVKNCEVYLDDIVAYSSSWSDHVESLRQIFARLRDASLTLNLAKCEFGKAFVTYLGKTVGQGQVRTVTAKVQAILDFPPPQTRRDLRRFLGMSGYYRAFCKNFAAVVAPLTNLVSPLIPFVWSSDCQSAFESAKALLCSAPVLAAPDFTRPFKLEVDASACGAGAVLLQEDGRSIDHPVSYFSKKFVKHQLHYSTIEKEALALLLALQHFEVYLGSSPLPVVVFSDHNPLVFLSRMRNNNQRLMRWSLLLQDFNIEIRHKKGTDNVLADALSRS